jgi:hypothetical protein
VSLLVLPENIDLSLSGLAAIPGHLKLLPQRLDLGLELGHLVPVGESLKNFIFLHFLSWHILYSTWVGSKSYFNAK